MYLTIFICVSHFSCLSVSFSPSLSICISLSPCIYLYLPISNSIPLSSSLFISPHLYFSTIITLPLVLEFKFVPLSFPTHLYVSVQFRSTHFSHARARRPLRPGIAVDQLDSLDLELAQGNQWRRSFLFELPLRRMEAYDLSVSAGALRATFRLPLANETPWRFFFLKGLLSAPSCAPVSTPGNAGSAKVDSADLSPRRTGNDAFGEPVESDVH